MAYDLDNPNRGVRECPRCRFTMERLRDSAALKRNEGYLLDSGTGFDPDDHIATSLLLGSWQRFLWRHFGEPLFYKLVGERRCRRYQRILRDYPHSLLCPHCHYLIQQR